MIRRIIELWKFGGERARKRRAAARRTQDIITVGTNPDWNEDVVGIHVEPVQNGYLLVYLVASKNGPKTVREFAADEITLSELLVARCIQKKLEQQ